MPGLLPKLRLDRTRGFVYTLRIQRGGSGARFHELEYSQAVAHRLWAKHGVAIDEVDEVLQTRGSYVRRAARGLYYVMGRTAGGRYIIVLLRDLGRGKGLLVTARDMDEAERRLYRRR